MLRLCGYLVGLSILLYPAASDYLNRVHSTTIAVDYEQEAAKAGPDLEERMLKAARAYNDQLLGSSVVEDPFSRENDRETKEDYENLLSLDSSGMMGYLQIPAINVLLPVYHGTSNEVLQTGVGHLEGTSLPVGGEGSHAVLSGHRGLPSAKLFTDLNKLKAGDVFYMKVMKQTFAYEVDQILVVKPEETEALAIEEGKDYITLVTCTPYAINTHRLLVRGSRIPYEEAVEVAQEMELKAKLPLYVKALAGAVTALLFIGILAKCMGRRRKR